MPTEVILHSVLHDTGELTHNIQTTNHARLKQILRLLQEYGYETIQDHIHSEDGYHTVTLWSYEDRTYSKVPRSEHTTLLRILKIPLNNFHRYPHIISTYAQLPPLRTRKPVRATSPRRLF